MMTMLRLEPLTQQAKRWPRFGRHILAQFDDDTVVVYQAYGHTIARFATDHGYFGGDFSFRRMSWIKPGFLWMMYRSGWASKVEQEVVLAVWLARDAFDHILSLAVPSSFSKEQYSDPQPWRADLERSDVRLQWDPDHDAHGAPLERRVIQLGLRGRVLAQYAREWIRRIEDITPIVRAQHDRLKDNGVNAVETPSEHVYSFRPSAGKPSESSRSSSPEAE